MSVNPAEHGAAAPAAHDMIAAELGRLVLCKRPIDAQRLLEGSTLHGLATAHLADPSTSAARLVDRLLVAAINSIDVGAVERAADALLTNHYGDRWVALADRQERAAALISDLGGGSLTRDGFRRKRKSDGRSHQDDVLEQVALAVLDIAGGPTAEADPADKADLADGPEPASVPIPPASWPDDFRPASETEGDDASSAGGRRAATAAVIVLGVALIVAGVVSVARRTSPDTTEQAATIEAAYDCPIAPAEAAPGIDAAPEQIDFLARTLADHLDETGMACPDRLADLWGGTDLIVQPLSSPSTGWTGALVATPEQMGFTLTTGQWTGLLFAHELTAEGDLPDLVPLNEEHREEASWVQAEAGWLVGERWGQPHFLVSGPWQQVWERNGRLDGRLGRPTSFVHQVGEVRRQDFAGGYLSTADGSAPTPHFNDTKAPPPVRPGDRIQQPDGTEWLIGTDRRRIWAALVPDRLPTGCSTAEIPEARGGDRATVHRIDGTRAARVPLSPSCTF